MPEFQDTSGTAIRATRDFIVLSLLVAGANYLLARQDAGWMKLNPTPWLLPAVLVGIRYGFTPGLLSGVAVSAGIAALQSHLSGRPVAEILHENAYCLLSLIVTGTIAGQAGTWHRKAQSRLSRSESRAHEENDRLRAQLHLVDETRHQLQQQLALCNAPLGALDEELARIFTFPREEFAHELLVTLHRVTRLTSAGIYSVNGGTLDRTAVIHCTPPLQPRLSLTATPLASEALEARALASVPDATALTSAQPFLAAFPWLDHFGRTSVLLIQDMPLDAYDLRNLARLELILSWASALAALRQTFTAAAGSDHTVGNDDFQVLIEEAINAEKVHRLPSGLVVVRHEGLRTADVLAGLPASAVATRLHGEAALAVLLPFSGATEASSLARSLTAMRQGVRSTTYVITGDVSGGAVWQSLQQA